MSACGHMESEDRVGCTRVFRSSRSLLRHEILQSVRDNQGGDHKEKPDFSLSSLICLAGR